MHRSWVQIAFASACLLFATTAFGDEIEKHASSKNANLRGKAPSNIYLLRGFGDVFSKGLDAIGAKLQKRGINAQVKSHSNWQSITREIIMNRKRHGRKPVVLIGHSLGANAVLKIGRQLKRNRIRVDYMATFAATNPVPVSSNVRRITNYYFKKDGWGKPVKRGAGFRGVLKNIDFSGNKSIGHFNIDEQPKLQNQVIRNILRYVRSRKRADVKTVKASTNG